MPGNLAYINMMLGAGVQLTLSDYRGLAAINRDDLVDWNMAREQRMKDEVALKDEERNQPVSQDMHSMQAIQAGR